jgi:hypothetical protein
MINEMLGSIAFLISILTSISFLCFLLVSLVRILRRRRLTIRELMAYVAGSGVAMALPGCFQVTTLKHRDVAMVDYHANRISYGFAVIAVSLVVFLIHRDGGRGTSV